MALQPHLEGPEQQSEQSASLPCGRAGSSSTFYLTGGISLLGMLVNFLLPESSRLDLKEEDREIEIFLAEKGHSLSEKLVFQCGMKSHHYVRCIQGLRVWSLAF